MNTPRVVLSLVSLLVALVVIQGAALRITQNQSGTIDTGKKPAVRQEVQSLRTTPYPMTSRSTPTTSVPTVTPSVRIKLGLSPIPPATKISPSGEPATTILNNFIYANATIIEQDDTHVVMQTFEPVQTVFQWYEKKLEEQNARQKATVKTQVNNDFLSKISAAVLGNVINIEIEKKSGENTTTIKLAIRPS